MNHVWLIGVFIFSAASLSGSRNQAPLAIIAALFMLIELISEFLL